MIDSPFPWFGGKKTIASEVWRRLGNVTNYVEPFFGSGAMLLQRPKIGHIETINDKDNFVANFWRSVKADPKGVAQYLDWPVNETDLSARHIWLLNEGAKRIIRCEADPDFYDVKTAGWWCWGICSWIGSGWCSGNGPWVYDTDKHCLIKRETTEIGGINRKLVNLGDAGHGVHRKRVHLGDAGQSISSLEKWMLAIADRLRYTRVCNGDWARVCGPSVTVKNGLTGIFLDPPYADTAGRTDNLYSTDSLSIAHDVREFAIKEGGNPLMRIALAGYEGEHTLPKDWTCLSWKTNGGFGSQGNAKGRVNSNRERIWFSPHCIPQQPGLLDLVFNDEC